MHKNTNLFTGFFGNFNFVNFNNLSLRKSGFIFAVDTSAFRILSLSCKFLSVIKADGQKRSNVGIITATSISPAQQCGNRSSLEHYRIDICSLVPYPALRPNDHAC